MGKRKLWTLSPAEQLKCTEEAGREGRTTREGPPHSGAKPGAGGEEEKS